jgi:hypothetical protein
MLYRVIIRKSNLKDLGECTTAKTIAEQVAAHYESELGWRFHNDAQLDFEIRYVCHCAYEFCFGP